MMLHELFFQYTVQLFNMKQRISKLNMCSMLYIFTQQIKTLHVDGKVAADKDMKNQ